MNLLYWLGWILGRSISRSLLRMKVINGHFIPKSGSFILACNHISYSDPVLIGSNINRLIHFMAKKELFRNRLFGAIIRATKAHPIRRGMDRESLGVALEILKSGQGLLIFPEGTRSRDGNFLPAKPGIGMVVVLSGVPVIPAYIHGSDKKGSCLRGKERLALIFGKPLGSDEISVYGDGKEAYRRLSADIMARIAKLKEEFIKTAKPA
ncbi:MAG: 1-acyl-sn-glycerol-3-phosphate acyltransferase [Candidatus Zixiibacteriota bacterium]|nr:MAG: 1-acyl-sn-glycerol-3-phosphate acyltransferase [candidate division Zixibacteria bacterium]